MDNQAIQEQLSKYNFYHVIKLNDELSTPGIREYMTVQNNVLKALQSMDIQGKKVLDIGCRDGLFCFESEKLGAKEVIGIDNDLSKAATEFLIPYFHSKVRMFEMNVYDLKPDTFGQFDVIIFAGVLYHLRYPFWALKCIRDVMTEHGKMILETAIVEAYHQHAILYCPIGHESPYEATSPTFFNIKGLCDTLYTLGISVHSIDSLSENM